MTAGNQGKAMDDANAALALDPNNAELKAAAARAKAAYDNSLSKAGQK